MTGRRANQILWAVSLAAGVGGAVALLLSVIMPLSIPDSAGSVANDRPGFSASIANDGVPSLRTMASAWAVDLRRPLVDVPPPAPVEPDDAEPVVAMPALHLYGTVIEPGHSMAMIADASGKTQFLAVGDTIQGARITSISVDAVGLQSNGKNFALAVEKPTAAALKGPALPSPEAIDPTVLP